MPQVVVRAPVFLSPLDESAFFGWLERIAAVRSVRGSGRELVIGIRSRRVSDSSLRELIAVFGRYKLPLSELAQFENATNSAWLRAPRTFWHRAMFSAAGV